MHFLMNSRTGESHHFIQLTFFRTVIFSIQSPWKVNASDPKGWKELKKLKSRNRDERSEQTLNKTRTECLQSSAARTATAADYTTETKASI